MHITFGMLAAQWRILIALILHDIRSRMGGTAFGFLAMAIGWPLAHMLLVIGIHSVLGRSVPFGDSIVLWYGTGVVPYLAFNYVSRYVMLGIVLNRPLLSIPIIKATDIVFARAIVEVLNSGAVVIIFFAIFWALGIDFLPRDMVQASLAMLAMIFLGLGYGVVNAVIAAMFRTWVTGFILIQIILWIASGVMFVPDQLPEPARVALSYLPPLQGVEWMRSAYFPGYGDAVLDKTYLITFSAAALFLGLAMERMMRGKLYQAS